MDCVEGESKSLNTLYFQARGSLSLKERHLIACFSGLETGALESEFLEATAGDAAEQEVCCQDLGGGSLWRGGVLVAREIRTATLEAKDSTEL